MSAEEVGSGVLKLARDLRQLQKRWKLAGVSASRLLDDGHTLTLRWSGDLLEVEREDGEVMLLDGELAR